jgi:hypothetical protein
MSKFPLIRILLFILIGALFCLPSNLNGQKKNKRSTELAYSKFKGQPAPSKDVLANLEMQASWDYAGPGGLNHSGLSLRFEKIDEQATAEGRVATRYRVYAEGASESRIYSFEAWPLGKNVSADPRDIYVNPQGLLKIHKAKPAPDAGANAADEELIVTTVTGSAEPMRYLLTSKDGKLQVFGTLVSHPLVSEEHGCELEARIADPEARSVLLWLEGFPEKTRIQIELESEGDGRGRTCRDCGFSSGGQQKAGNAEGEC